MFQNWSTKDEIESSTRTFQSVRDEIENTFSKIEWRDDENGRENLYYSARSDFEQILIYNSCQWNKICVILLFRTS